MAGIPTEEELGNRIRWHRARRPDDAAIVDAWSGYLAGLTEWGLLDADAYARLIGLLPGANDRVMLEIALGEYADEHVDDGAATARVA